MVFIIDLSLVQQTSFNKFATTSHNSHLLLPHLISYFQFVGDFMRTFLFQTTRITWDFNYRPIPHHNAARNGNSTSKYDKTALQYPKI